jgi:Uma2 family endonuclease
VGVRLFPDADEEDQVVVIPDILVVCDNNKLRDGLAVLGPPDFIAEVLSKSTRKHDLEVKRDLYREAGVKEYWAVADTHVKVHILDSGKYAETFHPINTPAQIPVTVLPGVVIEFEGAPD